MNTDTAAAGGLSRNPDWQTARASLAQAVASLAAAGTRLDAALLDGWNVGVSLAADGSGRAGRRVARDEVLADLRERFVKADAQLLALASKRSQSEEAKRRLEAKAEGVRLALSYLDEVTR